MNRRDLELNPDEFKQKIIYFVLNRYRFFFILVCFRWQRPPQRLFPPARQHGPRPPLHRVDPEHVCGPVRGRLHATGRRLFLFGFFSFSRLLSLAFNTWTLHHRSRRWLSWLESGAIAGRPRQCFLYTTWRMRTSVLSAATGRSTRAVATITTLWCTRHRFRVRNDVHVLPPSAGTMMRACF